MTAMPIPRIQRGEFWFVQRLGALNTEQMRTVEQAVAQVLGLKLASEGPQPMP